MSSDRTVCKLYFENQKKEIEVEKGILLADAIQLAAIAFDYPCGKRGSCGKCAVEIMQSETKETVLACHYSVMSSMHVWIQQTGEAQMLIKGCRNYDKWKPYCRRRLGLQADQPMVLAAFDIGTTSVVGYLLDEKDGTQLAVTSRFNPQRIYGADVVSRAAYEAEHRDGMLTRMIRQAVDEMLGELAVQAGIERHQIYQTLLVGNTCMHHLFLGIDPSSLLQVPYDAAMKNAFEGMAKDYGLNIAPEAFLQFLPNLAGYVGADTAGCLLAVDFLHEKKRTLMIDIGTNGELVMGTAEQAYTCSTAAGPALEGARISCGMCGIEGAIQHLKIENGELKLSVIGEKEAIGICGSGLIDAIALFKREGMIESRGRIQRKDRLKTDFAKKNAWRINRDNGKSQIMLTEHVSITQQDIREIQLAKSAIISGIQILCKKLDWKLEDLEQILLAGAFGNYMDPDNACEIGLLPTECRGCIRGIGNAAGDGAKAALADIEQWNCAEQLMRRIKFVELASEKDFQTKFIANLNF